MKASNDPNDFSNSGTAIVRIEIIDENDNSPEFEPFEPIDPIPEDTPVGSTVASITVTDRDSFDDGFDAEIISGNPGNAFRMSQAVKCGDETSGWCSNIIINNELDYDSLMSNYQLTIRVTDKKDSNGRTNDKNTVINIPIADIDDNPPILPFGTECIEGKVGSCPQVISTDETDQVKTVFTSTITDIDTEEANRQFDISFTIEDTVMAAKFSNVFTVRRVGTDLEFELVFNGYLLSRDECNLDIHLTITAVSVVNQSLMSTGTIIVNINDVNNNEPLIYYRTAEPMEIENGYIRDTLRIRNYLENSRTSKPVIELEYDDIDCNQNGHVLFLIETGFEYFELERDDSSTGTFRNKIKLHFLRKPDYEERVSYEVVLKAYDNPVNTGVGFTRREVRIRIQIELRDEDDNEPFFWFPGIRTQAAAFIDVNFDEETTGEVELVIDGEDELLLDGDTDYSNRQNKIFLLDPDQSGMKINSKNGKFYLEVFSPFDYEEIGQMTITIGCVQINKQQFSLSSSYNRYQVTTVRLNVNNIDDNPPSILGLETDSKILQKSVFLTETPDTENSILSMSIVDPDEPNNQDLKFIFNVQAERTKNRKRKLETGSRSSRQAESESEYFSVNHEAKVFLKKQIAPDIFYIDVDLSVKSSSTGPETDFTVRFYPINAETDVITLKSQESLSILSQRKRDIEIDLANAYGDNVKAIVHQIIPELSNRKAAESDSSTSSLSSNLIVAHVWNENEEIVDPSLVISKLISRESEEFLLEYKVIGIKSVEEQEDNSINILYIIIGVLGGTLFITVIVAVVTVRMLRNKFERTSCTCSQ